MTVLVGYVPTPEGRAALARAVVEAQRSGKELIVLVSPQDVSAEEQVAQAVSSAERDGLHVRQRTITHQKDPAEDIISVAERENADLIVIGLRRRTPVGKLILGSNAQRILLDAACPVLAVKAAPED